MYDSDPRQPDKFTTPILRANSTNSQAAGIIGLNRAAEPTLEQPATAIPYRSTYLAFGLEGVRNDTGATTRQQLLQNLLYWHVDRPIVQVSGAATVSGPTQLATFNATAETNTPATFVRYRWDFGDGSPILETDQATVVHQYAKAGTYQARVEATDSWGHRALAAGQGASAAGQGIGTGEAGGGWRAGRGRRAGAGGRIRRRPGNRSRAASWITGAATAGWRCSATRSPRNPARRWRRRSSARASSTTPRTRRHTMCCWAGSGSKRSRRRAATGRHSPSVASAPAGCRYFAETKHSLCGAFAAYWQSHGLEFDGRRGSSFAESLALFGMPISEPQQETIEGQTVLVQWFERARFEYHPENQAPYDVLLGRLGSALEGGAP